MKFFWRAKKDEATASESVESVADGAKPNEAETASASAMTSATSPAPANDDTKSQAAPQEAPAADAVASNVVTLQPARLTERIAAAAKTVVDFAQPEPLSPEALAYETLTPRPAGPLPGQEAAYEHLARALASAQVKSHIIVLGPAGSGRRTAARLEIERHRAVSPRPCDWIYVGPQGDGRRLKAFALPHGQGGLLVREARTAIARARTSHERLTASDEYRLGLEIIDEEFRQKAGKTLELLKRRAEDQNIALVKTPEGFVLAPMHEGKVVRSDVFRSLPESLQRDVEAKIAGLEGELKSFIDALPSEDTQQSERIVSFNRDTALRAVRPQMEPVRLAFNESRDLIDTLEGALVAAFAGTGVRREGGTAQPSLSTQVLAAQAAADFSETAPAVFAQDVSPEGLCGQLALDACGQLALARGSLMQANGGTLVIEAWRLAADPAGWQLLSSVLDTGEIRPRLAPGLALEVDPLPLSARVVILADENALKRLLAVDPGARRYFPYIVRMPAMLPRAVFDAGAYAAFAASIAQEAGLRPIAATAADALYRAAIARDGTGAVLPLDTHALRALLQEADLDALAAGCAQIRTADVETAAKRASETLLP